MSICSDCAGKCCSSFYVFVTAFDVVRIVEKLGIEPSKFLTAYPAKGLMEPAEYPTFKLTGRNFLLGLDTKLGKKDCIFLMDINGVKRCGIHAFRPISCRVYPFKLNKEENLETVEEMLCPKQWWPEGAEREEYKANAKQFRGELEGYKKIVERWNSQGNDGFINFIEFIINEVRGEGGALCIRNSQER